MLKTLITFIIFIFPSVCFGDFEWKLITKTKKHQEEYFAWRVSTGLTEAIEPYVSNVVTTYMDVKQSF